MLGPTGACLPPGTELDQCGVPGHNSTTCASHNIINVDLGVSISASGDLPASVTDQLSQLALRVAGKLGIAAAQVIVAPVRDED